MALTLPAPINAYFAADCAGDAEGLLALFTPDATVTDERQTHTGLAAIRAWQAGAARLYTYTAEPFALAEAGDLTIITAHLTGDFPGSPVDLRYAFTLAGDRIAALVIAP